MAEESLAHLMEIILLNGGQLVESWERDRLSSIHVSRSFIRLALIRTHLMNKQIHIGI